MKNVKSFIKKTSVKVFTLSMVLLAIMSCRKGEDEKEISVRRNPDLGFISIWKTDSTGIITIPVKSNYEYDYDIYWSKKDKKGTTHGEILNIKKNTDYTFSTNEKGEYELKIVGKFPAINFYGSGVKEDANRERIIDIKRWGNIEWESMEGAFYKCENLDISAEDIPNLSKVVSMENMFREARSLKANTSIDSWDVSNVKNMAGLFRSAVEFNQPIEKWDVGNVTTMESMFHNASKFNQEIKPWNVSNVTNMRQMFFLTNFNKPLEGWNVENVMNIEEMFTSCAFNQDLNSWKLNDKVECGRGVFAGSAFNRENIKTWERCR